VKFTLDVGGMVMSGLKLCFLPLPSPSTLWMSASFLRPTKISLGLKLVPQWSRHSVAPDIAAALKMIQGKNRYLASCSFRKKVLFGESPPSIMVTRNPNWSTKILWFGTGYVKGKILSPLKRSA